MSMEDKETTRTCGTCHKDVAEANFALHETHCKRFLCLCPDCNEPVPKEKLDQHREEQHTKVRCVKCYLTMERCHLEDHEADECEERLLICQFCELELPSKELDEHCLVCGSRTELCRDCGRYVTLRDKPDHDSTCSATDDASGPPQTASKLSPSKTKTTAICSRCMASFPAEDIELHELTCVMATRLDYEKSSSEEEESEFKKEESESEDEEDLSGHRSTPWLSRAFKASSLSTRGTGADADDPDQIRTCPYCHLTLPVFTLRWHEVKCQVLINLQ
ncbi:XIAP-associated factor 1 [Anoplopoma fimbria]|uniref:XIAP-associated factor 1 n=1 Tax=Anoplopoma fimbria TaxID=229290 RepID=UPI0023EDE912|nr:XIAP-associated factor 1 [Anoplopoma fimbria]